MPRPKGTRTRVTPAKPKHSAIGASSAHRWFECPGSVALCEKAPKQVESSYAQQGTAAHELIEKYFTAPANNLPDLDLYVGLPAENGYEYTQEDVDSVKEFIAVVEDYRAEAKFILHAEAKFQLDCIFPDLRGTADIVLVASDMSRLVVLDYKHGMGVPVEVEDNHQLLYYALGAINYVCEKHGQDLMLGWGGVFQKVDLVVVQPRCKHPNGIARAWSVSSDRLDAFAEELLAAVKATQEKNAPLKTGDHCRWCAARGICPAQRDASFAVAKTDFSVEQGAPPAPELLAVEDIAKILKAIPTMESWIKAVEAQALFLLQSGKEVPGFKLVQKKANWKWKDEAAAAEELSLYLSENELYEPKSLLSPAKVEKLLKKDKKVLEDLVEIPNTGTTIAPEYDKREPVKFDAAADFKQVE